MKPKLIILVCLFGGCFTIIYCNSDHRGNITATPLYRNWNDSVKYVGMNTCKTCHEGIYESFVQTGMGESWGHATMEKSSAIFDKHAVVYDKYRNFYYRPFWKDSTLFILEFRLEGKDTTYKRLQKISYIVGSGQHTNSHIWSEDGYLFQAPLTFYTQKGTWDLPPGFEEGLSTRWNRIISIECMNCHNMYPQFDTTSENKFITVKSGIECERCHGPGELHVQEKMAGMLVDTSKEIDYSIVNPKKLSRDMQVELCQRCHLQGISVLNPGKTFFDFKPGQPLNSVMNVFLPRYEGGEEKFIMASHADRMKQSNCYKNSRMTCLTCHNPHISVKFTPAEHFNDACKSCHGGSKGCTLPIEQREKEGDNCYKCHMQVSETLDIPHVTVHDHKIQVPVSEEKKNEIRKFAGLECITTAHPSDLLMAQGYLQTYEAFSPQPYLLDSAWKYLTGIASSESMITAEKIRYYYLSQKYPEAVAISQHMEAATIKDAWTAYRIGEANYQTGNFTRAYEFFKRATLLKPLDAEFGNKLGSTLVALNRLDEAEATFQKIVKEHNSFAPGWSNLGYIYFLKGDLAYSSSLYDKAIGLDPDYEQALMNRLGLLIVQRKNAEAHKLAERILGINPRNEKAKMILKQLSI